MIIGLLYIVERTYSNFGEVWWNIAGIFTNPKDAEELKDRLNAEAQRIKDESPPYPEDGLFEDDEQMHAYYAFWRENDEYDSWTGATVMEYPVNQRIPFPKVSYKNENP